MRKLNVTLITILKKKLYRQFYWARRSISFWFEIASSVLERAMI